MKIIFKLIALCSCLQTMLNNAYSLDEIEEDIKRGTKTLDTAPVNQSISFSAEAEAPEAALPQETTKKRTSVRTHPIINSNETNKPAESVREEDGFNAYDRDRTKKRPSSIKVSTSIDSDIPEAKKTKSPKTPKKASSMKDTEALPSKTVKSPNASSMKDKEAFPGKTAKPPKATSSVDEKFPGIDVKFVGGQRIVKNTQK